MAIRDWLKTAPSELLVWVSRECGREIRTITVDDARAILVAYVEAGSPCEFDGYISDGDVRRAIAKASAPQPLEVRIADRLGITVEAAEALVEEARSA